MNFDIPEDLQNYLGELDAFIESDILPLQMKDDNNRFFDHRREHARTDWDKRRAAHRGLGVPADRRPSAWQTQPVISVSLLPWKYGGRDGSNLEMAVIREHLATRGLGLHNDLQNEHSIVGNNIGLLLMIHYGSDKQKSEWIDDLSESRRYFTVGYHGKRPRLRRHPHGNPRDPDRKHVDH